MKAKYRAIWAAQVWKWDISPLFAYLSTKPYKHKNDVTKIFENQWLERAHPHRSIITYKPPIIEPTLRPYSSVRSHTRTCVRNKG